METIHDYQLIKVIGRGSFATVHLAKFKQTAEEVALKQVSFKEAKDKDKQCALNEVRLLASISHPNIINFKNAFFNNENQKLYISMEYAKKGDLSRKIQYMKLKRKYLSEQEIWKFIRQTSSALKVLHENNIIHRDLKSANIFVTEEGDYKIGDFNVAKLIKNSHGLAETKTGTPLYASPEVWQNNGYNIKSDIWSLGVIAYELASLQLPFPAKTFPELIQKINKNSFERIPSIFSDNLHRVISSMIHKNPSKRPTANKLISYSGVMILNEMLGNNVVVREPVLQKKCSMIDTIQNPAQLPKLRSRVNTCLQPNNIKQQAKKQIYISAQQKNKQNIENSGCANNEKSKSYYRARAITMKQRVLSIKAIQSLAKQKIVLKPIVLNVGVNENSNSQTPLTERKQVPKGNKRILRLPSLNSHRNQRIQ